MKEKIIVFVMILLIAITAIPIAYAADDPIIPEISPSLKLVGPDKAERDYFLAKFIPNVFSAFIGGIGVFALIFLLIGGIQMITSFGSEEGFQTAKKTIIWSIVGLVIALLSYSIVFIVTSLASYFK